MSDYDGDAMFHRAEGTVLSSLLPASAFGARHVRGIKSETELVRVSRLDTVLVALAPTSEKVFLKVDAQGNDYRVLLGSENILDRIVLVWTELHAQPIYAGAADYIEPLRWLDDRGFRPVQITVTNRIAGRVAEMEAIYAR